MQSMNCWWRKCWVYVLSKFHDMVETHKNGARRLSLIAVPPGSCKGLLWLLRSKVTDFAAEISKTNLISQPILFNQPVFFCPSICMNFKYLISNLFPFRLLCTYLTGPLSYYTLSSGTNLLLLQEEVDCIHLLH